MYSIAYLHLTTEQTDAGQPLNEISDIELLKTQAAIIMTEGPLTKDEADQLFPEQLSDYMRFTICVLRDLGEEVFRRERIKMRLFLIHRLARGQSLMPSDDELNGPGK